MAAALRHEWQGSIFFGTRRCRHCQLDKATVDAGTPTKRSYWLAVCREIQVNKGEILGLDAVDLNDAEEGGSGPTPTVTPSVWLSESPSQSESLSQSVSESYEIPTPVLHNTVQGSEDWESESTSASASEDVPYVGEWAGHDPIAEPGVKGGMRCRRCGLTRAHFQNMDYQRVKRMRAECEPRFGGHVWLGEKCDRCALTRNEVMQMLVTTAERLRKQCQHGTTGPAEPEPEPDLSKPKKTRKIRLDQ